jgi:26S proteasome regulatory subunit T2
MDSMFQCVLCYVINFKVVMATNRIETLDPALIRPGRIDRKIEFPLPDEKTKRRIFNIHTSRMTLAADVNLTELIMSKDDLSGADIKVRRYFSDFATKEI